MSFKKFCMFIIISSIAFSGETFARYENDDAKSRVSAKRRPIRASQTTRKSLPQKATPSSHLRRSLAARKRTAVPTNTRRASLTTAQKRTDAPASTRRAPLTTAQKRTAVPANKRRASLATAQMRTDAPANKRRASLATAQKKPATLPKSKEKTANPVRVQTPLPVEKKQIPAKTPIAKKTDEPIFENEEVKRSFAALKQEIKALKRGINALGESIDQDRKATEKLRRASNALGKSSEELGRLLNTPGFVQKLQERFNKLDDKKKEEFRKQVQKLRKVSSNK
ncbi:MAG: hypothetical protein K2Y08_06395 [Alphaproteobacteria bacterium]|nr:hypothetical protein [Alphaproteobacteria bacterium]